MGSPSPTKKDKKEKKRNRSATPNVPPSVATTPPQKKSPPTANTTSPAPSSGTTTVKLPPSSTGTPSVAEGKIYALKDIVANVDFRLGIVRARCTGAELKEKTGKATGKVFWVLQVLLTDSVTRMLSVVYFTADAIPALPKNGDLIQVKGVKPVVATYDALTYGPVQLLPDEGFKMMVISVELDDPRIPKHWSSVSVLPPQEPQMSVEDFLLGL